MNLPMKFMRKLSFAYNATCKPLCHKLKLPQTALDILLFLANNPQYTTARDIVEICHHEGTRTNRSNSLSHFKGGIIVWPS